MRPLVRIGPPSRPAISAHCAPHSGLKRASCTSCFPRDSGCHTCDSRPMLCQSGCTGNMFHLLNVADDRTRSPLVWWPLKQLVVGGRRVTPARDECGNAKGPVIRRGLLLLVASLGECPSYVSGHMSTAEDHALIKFNFQSSHQACGVRSNADTAVAAAGALQHLPRPQVV